MIMLCDHLIFLLLSFVILLKILSDTEMKYFTVRYAVSSDCFF